MQSVPSQPSRPAELGGLARVVFAGIIWGTIPLVLRAADGASVVKVFYRVFFAGVAILLWMTATRTLGQVTGLSRRKLAQVAAQGALLCLNWVLFLSALDRTSVATAELLGYTGPVFVALFAPFVTGERFDKRIFVPLALSLGGIVVILAPQGLRVASPRELFGAALAFCSALTYATLLLRSKKILRGISGMSLMLVEYTVASTILLPFVVWFYAHGQGPSTPTAYAALLTLGTGADGFLRRVLPVGTPPDPHRPRRDTHLRRARLGSAVRSALPRRAAYRLDDRRRCDGGRGRTGRGAAYSAGRGRTGPAGDGRRGTDGRQSSRVAPERGI